MTFQDGRLNLGSYTPYIVNVWMAVPCIVSLRSTSQTGCVESQSANYIVLEFTSYAEVQGTRYAHFLIKDFKEWPIGSVLQN